MAGSTKQDINKLTTAPDEDAFFDAEASLLRRVDPDKVAKLLEVIEDAAAGKANVNWEGVPMVLGELGDPAAVGPLARLFVRLRDQGWPRGRAEEEALTKALRKLAPGKKLKAVLREHTSSG